MGSRKQQGSRMGRPPLAPGQARTERVVAFLRPAEHEKLRKMAEARGVEVGVAAREILERALRRKGGIR